MGKSSGLVTHMTGFDSRIRIQSGCSAMAARRVRDPEDAGSSPATLTRRDTGAVAPTGQSNWLSTRRMRVRTPSAPPATRPGLPVVVVRVEWLDGRWV